MKMESAKALQMNGGFGARIRKVFLNNWRLYLLLLPGLIWLIVFCYIPMYGLTIAFKDFDSRLGIIGSPFVGLKYFRQFFSTNIASKTILNTMMLGLAQLIFAFPVPVVFALLLNQLPGKYFKKTVQTISFAPHFISVVVLVSMLNIMLAPKSGFVNQLIVACGGKPVFFTSRSEYFRPLYVLSGIWQSMGYSAIIYISALTGVSPDLHEAAVMDGASKMQRIWHIDIPSIMPTVIIMLILQVGKLFSTSYEKALLMQNALNIDVSELIATYVYKVGLVNAQYSFSTAAGLFNSLVNFVLLLTTNLISRKVLDIGLF